MSKSLKQTLISIGLVCSILTAIVGVGKEVSDVAKEWSSNDKTEMVQLHAEIEALSKKMDERDMKQQRANLSIRQQILDLRMATAYSALSTAAAPKTMTPMAAPSPILAAPVVEAPTEVVEVAQAAPMTTMSEPPKSGLKLGWIIGIIGLACGAIFSVLHLMHKKGPTPNA